MKKKNPLNLFKFVELLVNARIAYNNVKNDEEAKKTTTIFGKRSLVYVFIFALMAAGATALIYWGIVNFATSWIFLAIFAFVISVYLVIYAIGMFVLSLNLAIKQISLNKKPVGIIALVFNIIIAVALIIGIIIIALWLGANA